MKRKIIQKNDLILSLNNKTIIVKIFFQKSTNSVLDIFLVVVVLKDHYVFLKIGYEINYLKMLILEKHLFIELLHLKFYKPTFNLT